MQKVKTKVHSLTSAYHGISNIIVSPFIAINIDSGSEVEIRGIWDTGATHTNITSSLAKELNLIPKGKALINGVHGVKEVNTYSIKVKPKNQDFEMVLKVSECDELVGGTDIKMLIGMDVISRGDFIITNHGNTVMTFRTPSLATVDFVKQGHTNKPADAGKLPTRNQPCPCGSGKKYKHCHGK
jgi:hypothetical protein